MDALQDIIERAKRLPPADRQRVVHALGEKLEEAAEPAPAESRSKADSLLDELLLSLDAAIGAADEGDTVGTDSEMMPVRRLSPALVVMGLGDAFAMAASALSTAARSTGMVPATGGQLKAIQHVLRELRDRPSLTNKEAIQLARSLQTSGLPIHPQDLSLIEDAVDANRRS